MRILKVAQTYYPCFEGGGRPAKVRGIARALQRRGHLVTVLTADLADGAAPWDGGSPAERRRLEKTRWGWAAEEAEGPKVAYLPTLGRYRFNSVNPRVFRYCVDELRSFDLVHIYGLYDLLGAVVTWFCRRWSVPYVVEPMGMYRPMTRSLRKKRLYHRLLGGAMLQGSACLIATSDQERRELLEDGLPAQRVVVRRNGLDLSEFQELPPRGAFRKALGVSDGELLALYLGRLSGKKGLDVLLQAFAGLSTPARLAIVGTDDRDGTVEELRRLRAELGIQRRVTIAGPRFGPKKLEAFVDADLFVLPSQHENFGNAAAEAIACGVPIVITDRCGIAPRIRDRVGIVVPYDSGRLRAAIEQMLTNQALREEFRANARIDRTDLSWEEPVRVTETLYESLLVAAGRS